MTKQLKDLKLEDCKALSDEMLLNAQQRWESALFLADKLDYGGAIHYHITSLEEIVKSIFMLLDSKGFEFRKVKGIQKIVTKSHIQRHFLMFWIFIFGLFGEDIKALLAVNSKTLKLLNEKKELQKRVLIKYIKRKITQIREEIEWFSKTETIRQLSVYVDYNNGILSPISISESDYKIVFEKLNKVYLLCNQLIIAFEYEKDEIKTTLDLIKMLFVNLKFYELIGKRLDYSFKNHINPFDFTKTFLDEFSDEDWYETDKFDFLNSMEFQPVLPFIEGKPTKLIVGTFPPHITKWDFDFFFPNLQNRLWPTLAKIATMKLTEPDDSEQWKISAVVERKTILNALNSGMVNIIQRCKRKEGISALDNDLEVLSIHNILEEILMVNPTIKSIFLTSSSGKNSCLSLFKRHLKENSIEFILSNERAKTRESKINNPLIGGFHFKGNDIKVYSLYSPSPTTKRAGIKDDILESQYNIIAEK